MKRTWIIVVALLGVIAGGMFLASRLNRSPWTTDSYDALQEFEKGLEAEMRYYGADARAHYERAIDLDPDFVLAKLALLEYERDKHRRAEIHAELIEAPLEKLSARERFIVQYVLADIDHRPDEAEKIISEYLAERPNDPFALAFRCEAAWEARDLEAAEEFYKQLLKADPNWVMAQNHLGYIAMAQGRFAEAEELFNTYNYIAPDQANPHDSLGELLTLLGRYDEAKFQLQEALRIKPDFCASYTHLLSASVLAGEFEEAEAYLDAGLEDCGRMISAFTRCRLDLWRAFSTQDYESAWSDDNAACRKRLGQDSFIVHRLAILTGRTDEALNIESIMQKRIQKVRESVGAESKMGTNLLNHVMGVRLIAASDAESALQKLVLADDNLLYWGQGQGLLKLFNRLHIAIAHDELGQPEKARALLAEIRAINPRMAESYEELRTSLTTLGD